MSLESIQTKLQRLEVLGGPAELEAFELLLAERIRQVDGEGWTPAHDDRERREGQLAAAGASYALAVAQKAVVHARTGSLDVKPSAPHARWLLHSGTVAVAEDDQGCGVKRISEVRRPSNKAS